MLTFIQSYPSRIEANIAKGLLKSNGIESYIFADDVGGAYPFPFATTVGVLLKVKLKDLKKAKNILKSETKKTGSFSLGKT